jgi:hypothetical protein
MQSAIPAQKRPAHNALVAVSQCAKITSNRVERVSRFLPDLPFPTSSAVLEARARRTSRAKKSLGRASPGQPAYRLL